jgi:hypothetical protein
MQPNTILLDDIWGVFASEAEDADSFVAAFPGSCVNEETFGIV